jgi:hypothetical protein
VSRLRQPIPAAQAIALLISFGGYTVTQHWTGRLSPAGFVVVLLLPQSRVPRANMDSGSLSPAA